MSGSDALKLLREESLPETLRGSHQVRQAGAQSVEQAEQGPKGGEALPGIVGGHHGLGEAGPAGGLVLLNASAGTNVAERRSQLSQLHGVSPRRSGRRRDGSALRLAASSKAAAAEADHPDDGVEIHIQFQDGRLFEPLLGSTFEERFQLWGRGSDLPTRYEDSTLLCYCSNSAKIKGMEFKYLGDALDHFKGSIFRRLIKEGALVDIAVDPMATDRPAWKDDHFRLYGELLGVSPDKIVKETGTLDHRGRRPLGLSDHSGDHFLDPNSGIRSGSQTPVRNYVRPSEVVDLCKEGVVAVYQHAWREEKLRWVKKTTDAVIEGRGLSVTAYSSTQVAMLFFSADSSRIQQIHRSLGSWFGSGESCVYPVQTDG